MKGRKTNLEGADCGIARSLQIVGDWWTLLIVRDAFRGHQRFGEFQKNLGLAKNILSARLKKLVQEGIFTIEAHTNSPSSPRYILTPKGEKLYTLLVALWQWGEENCFEPGELETEMVDTIDGAPIERLQVKAADGRLLGPRDFRLASRPSSVGA
ncbi:MULTISPECIES: helix-turn-helix domain-containing protein [Rhizobium/Agrobacterium group]|jgi:DNA-binding HxlR family transcriptional regulator|uniref:Helix-turn-helix domain-containing protein n=1 Tax=Neorhizobium petrolearium TaxID=515361 RepID=A0ABY8M782_9HYPH|nr:MULTISPECIES: helix-turn-helix domain-containing protein [Rhizobium/Agrobacterium group]MCC2609073.1 helix-turn-helix transcriptional regulator [Neorhizobium petrolearium]WGI69305.1 helix-turn-helix domain-containing protein [Neorhizobium petrolearium]